MKPLLGDVREWLKELDLPEPTNILPLQKDLSTRTYYRLTLNEVCELGNSLVLCVHSGQYEATISDFVSISRQFKEAGVAAPDVIAQKQHWLLQTDAGSIDLRQHCLEWIEKGDTQSIEITYERLLDQLVRLQAVTPSHPVSGRFFDFDKLHFEMEHFALHVAQAGQKFAREYFYSFEFQMFLKTICEKLAQSSSKVFVHRDLHSKNVMRSSEDLVWIDFQDARSGLRYYDLASLLYDPYLPLSRDFRTRMLSSYAKKSGKAVEENLFYMQSFQRLVKAIGTYMSVIHTRQDRDYLGFLRQAAIHLEEVVQLGGFPDHTFLFVRGMQKFSELEF